MASSGKASQPSDGDELKLSLLANPDEERTVGIIQARMGSTRLPGKVLLRLGKKEVLTHVIMRLRGSGVFDEIVVATTRMPEDDKVAQVAAENGAAFFRGSETDVLGRYLGASQSFRAKNVVRITADCPLIDPDVVAEMVNKFRKMTSDAEKVDLLSNSRKRTYPRGLDTEIFSHEALMVCDLVAKKPYQREHVTPCMYENTDRFTVVDHTSGFDFSEYRLTLDTFNDYELLKRIFGVWEDKNPLDLRLKEVIEIMENNPEWMKINAHVTQKQAIETT